jgi:hypothetical protein
LMLIATLRELRESYAKWRSDAKDNEAKNVTMGSPQ